MAEMNKRAKLLMKTPNPVYLSWLEEWLLEARKKPQPKRIRELTLATESLRKYPVCLNSAKECIILENFSRQLVDEIERREKQEADGGELLQTVLQCSASRWRSAKSPTKSMNAGVSSPTDTSKQMRLSPAKVSKPMVSSPAKASKFKASSPAKASKAKASSPTKASRPRALSPAKAAWHKASPTKTSHFGPSSSTSKFIEDYPSGSISCTDFSNQVPLPRADLDEESHRKQLSLVQDLIAPSKTTQKSRRKETNSQDDLHEAMETQDTPVAPETIIFAPGSFQIIMLIDTGEKGFLSSVAEFSDPEFLHEVRHLKVGDYAWVARGPLQKELLLPFLVERKRLDDLSKSVKDGRFSEQKFRLKMSNIPNIIYLIENHDVRGNTQSIIQGISNMLIKDLFTVKETRDNMDSMRYLANMTRYLLLTMAGKTLVSSAEYDPDCGLQSDLVCLPEFGFFFAGMGKLRTFTTKEMFTKQLVQLHGLSADKAWAIVTKYQTPKALIEAFQGSGTSLLSDLTYGLLNRKLGQNVSSILYKFYTSIDFN